MKKILILLVFSNITLSELVLEITQGTDDPYKVALMKFEGDISISNTINRVVTNNLKRTGEFKVFDNNKLLSQPKDESEIIFNDFRILDIDYLVLGNIVNDEKLNISVEYHVFDIKKGSKVRTSTIFGIPNKNRQLSHYISDGIYEEITGIKGIAFTKILYVTEKYNFYLVIADADGKK